MRSIPIFRILVAVDRRQSKLTTADAVGSSDGPLEVARVTMTVRCCATKLVTGGDRV